MSPASSKPSEIAIPSASLVALRRALTSELDADAAARVLRSAGHDAGDAFHQLLAADDVTTLDANAFWRRFAQMFATRGWGSLQHADVHPGIAALAAGDWAEADASDHTKRPSCFFTTGLLANVLGKVAGGDVSVMEVECRSRGDSQCRFLFGSPIALRGLYDLLVEGQSADSAVKQLA